MEPRRVGEPSYGVDVDRTGPPEPARVTLLRRLQGRFPIDPFGADPMVMDALAPLVGAAVRVRVEHADRIPARGPAVLVVNRGTGVFEPTVLAVAVRRHAGRRLRVVNVPNVPLLAPVLRKLGGIGTNAPDLAALLRRGHLAAVPLGASWLRAGAGTPPLDLLTAAVGYPVLPVAVRPSGPLGLPVRGWVVTVGRPSSLEPGLAVADPLAAAELAESVREGVEALGSQRRHPASR